MMSAAAWCRGERHKRWQLRRRSGRCSAASLQRLQQPFHFQGEGGSEQITTVTEHKNCSRGCCQSSSSFLLLYLRRSFLGAICTIMNRYLEKMNVQSNVKIACQKNEKTQLF